MVYFLYGMGKSNISVKSFLEKNNYKYYVYEDGKDYNGMDIDKLKKEDTIIVKSPGINNNTQLMRYFIQNNFQILTDLGLFYMFFPNYFYIVITGSVGKTTTVLTLNQILKGKFKVGVAGNIGNSIFNILNTNKKIILVEASSYELEFCGSFRPNIFLILKTFPHHLDHHLSFDNYLKAKFYPLINMDKECYCILPKTLVSKISKIKTSTKIVFYDPDDITNKFTKDGLLISNHKYIIKEKNNYFKSKANQENFLGIIKVLEILKINLNDAILSLENFSNPHFRQEEVYNRNNLIIINDSKSTCFVATINAIDNTNNKYKNLEGILIIGGKLNDDVMKIKELGIFKTIYIFGEMRIRKKEFDKNNGTISISKNSLIEIIESIHFKNNLVILFSPGAQSFDQFTSYVDRGNYFNTLIFKKLKI